MIQKIKVALTWLDTVASVIKAGVAAAQAIVSLMDAGKAAVDLIKNGECQ